MYDLAAFKPLTVSFLRKEFDWEFGFMIKWDLYSFSRQRVGNFSSNWWIASICYRGKRHGFNKSNRGNISMYLRHWFATLHRYRQQLNRYRFYEHTWTEKYRFNEYEYRYNQPRFCERRKGNWLQSIPTTFGILKTTLCFIINQYCKNKYIPKLFAWLFAFC